MNEAKFYLEKRKNDKIVVDKNGNEQRINVPIRMSFHFNGKRLEYYTGIRVNISGNFNESYPKEGKAYINPQEPEAGRKNKRLNDLKAKAQQIYDNAIALEITPDPEYIKKKLDEQFKGKVEKVEEKLLKHAFTEFLDFVKKKRSLATWKRHNTTLNHLERTYGKKFHSLVFKDINSAFIEKFRSGLVDSGYKEKDDTKEYLHNTIVKYMRCFREFLNWCKDEKRAYYKGAVKFDDMQENDINIIFLNAEQISKLEQTEMPNKRLEQVKDVFLFGVYTAMRHSDLYKLKKKDVFDDFIRFYITKNKETKWHEVPLIEQSMKILDKYKNMNGEKALPVISNQKMNLYIKEVMKIAEFNDLIIISEKKGDGTIEEKEYALWELVSCHTSRKSFISYAVEAGLDEIYIKAITGHSKNSRSLHKYYEVSAEKKRKEMQKIFGKSAEPKMKAV